MKKNETNETQLAIFDQQDTELFADLGKKEKRVIGYLPSFFTTASLPYRNLHKTEFSRKGSTGITLKIQSPLNVPFGKYGRLLLSALCTHAVISKEKGRDITIRYASLKDLLDEMQLVKQRGADIREQLDCFTAAQFVFTKKEHKLKNGYLLQEVYEDGQYPKGDVEVITHSTGAIHFTKAVQYQEVIDSNTNKVGYISIILSADFVEFCQNHAVPIDYTVYKEISSASGKDLYAWLVYRNNGMRETNTKSVFIPRDKMIEQFMPVDEKLKGKADSVNYSRIVDELKKIKEKFYPEVKFSVDETGAGITLYKSPTPVIKNDKRYALITTDI